MINANVNIGCTGRYRIEVCPALRDVDGTLMGAGDCTKDTPWGENLITNVGFNRMFAGEAISTMSAVLGSGNAVPDEANTSLAAYRGHSTSFQSYVRSYSSTPDAEGNVWVKVIYKYEFAPGSLGSGTVNLAEAGMVFGSSSPGAMTPVGSRSLLVDSAGNPTTVSIDASEEFVYLYWEFTMFFPAEVTGSFNLDDDGTVTSHTFVLRPSNFPKNPSWYDEGGNRLFVVATPDRYGSGPQVNNSSVYSTGISDLESLPTGYSASNIMSSAIVGPYTPGSKTRLYTCRWLPTVGNIAVRSALLFFTTSAAFGADSHTWQVEFDPVIPKVNTKRLDLNIRVTMGNK